MFSKIKLNFKNISKNLKVLLLPLVLLLASVSVFSAATVPVNISAADDGFVDCNKKGENGQPDPEVQLNIKCMTQIVGARCFIPDAKGNCKWEKSVLGAIFDFLVNFGPIIAVLIIAYGGYQFYFSGLSGNAKGGRQAIAAGVAGLFIIMMVAIYKEFILGFTPNNDNASTAAVTYSNKANNIGFQIVTVVIVPVVKVLQFASAAFAVISLIFAGYWFIVGNSTGDSDASKKGKAGLKNALIGILLVILSVTIIQLLSNFVDSFK